MDALPTTTHPTLHDLDPMLWPITGRVLLAEDDDELRRLFASALRRDGHEVIEISDGERLRAAMCALLSHGAAGDMPDVVVSDIRMPGRTGIDVLLETGRERWPTPFVLLTAFGDEETLSRARHAGADIVLDKPVELDTLRRIVRILIGS